MKAKLSAKILSPVLFIILWYGLARIVNAALILPYPHSVIIRLIALVQNKNFWLSFGMTLLRVFISFKITMLLGFILGLLSADYPAFKNLIAFPLAVIRATPLIAFILLALFWFKSSAVPVFVAVLMSLPVMLSAVEKGFEHTKENQEKLFKASCYGFNGFRAFYYIRLPAAKASIYSGAESSFGLCWKVIAAGEVLSLPKYAAGTMMQQAQVHLETCDVLALTLVLVIFSIICQKIINHYFCKKCIL